MPLTKDLYGMSTKDWSEWRWAFSYYGVENWLLLRIMCGAKRLNPFFRLHKASEVLNKNVSCECGQVASPLPLSLVSLWLFLFLISRQFRIKYLY